MSVNPYSYFIYKSTVREILFHITGFTLSCKRVRERKREKAEKEKKESDKEI